MKKQEKTTINTDELAHILGNKIKNISTNLKEINGNKGISNSDMIWYLTHKIDKQGVYLTTAIDNINKNMKNFVTIAHFNDFEKSLKEEKKLLLQKRFFTLERVMAFLAICIAAAAVIFA